MPSSFHRFAAGLALAASLCAASANAAPPAPGDTLTLSAPIAVPPTFGNTVRGVGNPAMATNGTDVLVAWQDSLDFSVSSDIACIRYGANGARLDTMPAFAPMSGIPTVLWDGAQYVLIAGGNAAHVDPATGAPGPVFALPASVPPTDAVAFASGGGVILATWQSLAAQTTVEAALIDGATGNLLKAPFAAATLPAGGGAPMAVAYAGGEFLLVAEYTLPGDTGIAAVRVSTAGAVLDATPIVIAGSLLEADGGQLESGDGGSVVAANMDLNAAGGDAQFLVSWSSGPAYAARVGTDGTVVDPGGILLSSYGVSPHGGWSGSSWWVLWENSLTVGAASFGASGTNMATVSLGSSPEYYSDFLGAVTSQTLFSAWQGAGILGFATSLASVDGGTLVAPAPTQLDHFPDAQTSPSVTATSEGYLVSWSVGAQRFGARYTAAGALVDAEPLLLGQSVIGAITDAYVVASPYDATNLQPVLSTIAATGDGGLAPFGTVGVPGDLTSLSPTGACIADRCALLYWQDDAEIGALIDLDGGVLGGPFTLGAGAFLSDVMTAAAGGSSLLLSYVRGSSSVAAVQPLGASGVLGEAFPSLPAVDSVGAGGGGYLALSTASDAGVTAYWVAPSALDASFAAGDDGGAADVSSLAPLPAQTFFAGAPASASHTAWDGRAFLTSFTDATGAVVGAELALPGADAGDASSPPTFTVFPDAGPTGAVGAIPEVASAVFASSQPQTGFAIPQVALRWVTFAADASDAGPDAGDAGDAGDADDAGGPAPTDAGTDATLTSGGGEAGAIDGSTESDASGATAAGGTSSGCGCATAGRDAGDTRAWAVWAVAGCLVVVRRRRSNP